VKKKVYFTGNERVDLPDFYEGLITLTDLEFQHTINSIVDDEKRILYGFKVVAGTGLNAEIENEIGLGYNGRGLLGMRELQAGADVIALSPSTNHYIELEFYYEMDEEEPRAQWNPEADESIEQEQDTRSTLKYRVVSPISTSGFDTASICKIPLSIVTTDATSVINVTDSRPLTFSHQQNYVATGFGSPRSDIDTIKNIRDNNQALYTIIQELKGTTNWYDEPSSNIEDLYAQLNETPGEWVVYGDGSTTDYIVTTFFFNDDNADLDIKVYVNGAKKQQELTGVLGGATSQDYIKLTTNSIRFLTAPALDSKIVIRRERRGSSGLTSLLNIKWNGTLIKDKVADLNFTGAGIGSISTPGAWQVDVNIPGGGGGGSGLDGSFYRQKTNNTGGFIAQYAVIILDTVDNTKFNNLADSTIVGRQNAYGITLASSNHSDVINVFIGGVGANILTALGFSNNEEVYLGASGTMVDYASVPDTGSPDDALVKLGDADGNDLIWNKQFFSIRF